MPNSESKSKSNSSSQALERPLTWPAARSTATTISEKSTRDGNQRDPSRESGTPAAATIGQQAAEQENDDQPEQNHRNNTIAINTTDPRCNRRGVPAHAAGFGKAKTAIQQVQLAARYRCKGVDNIALVHVAQSR